LGHSYLLLSLIRAYQRFISPYKGFHCAHHQLHRGDTCSNAVKYLIQNNSFRAAIPLIRARFKACHQAAQSLQAIQSPNTDLPIPCDCSFDLPVPSGKGGCNFISPCDFLFDWPKLSRTARRIILSILAFLVLAFALYYGSRITKVEIAQISINQRSDGLMQRLLSRKNPSLRAMIIVNQEKIYSNIYSGMIQADAPVITLDFKQAFDPDDVTLFEIHDARFTAGGELIVMGQVLESFTQPKVKDQGKRFEYAFKSRWFF